MHTASKGKVSAAHEDKLKCRRRTRMKERTLEQIKAEAIRQINESEALDKLNDVRVAFRGRRENSPRS